MFSTTHTSSVVFCLQHRVDFPGAQRKCNKLKTWPCQWTVRSSLIQLLRIRAFHGECLAHPVPDPGWAQLSLVPVPIASRFLSQSIPTRNPKLFRVPGIASGATRRCHSTPCSSRDRKDRSVSSGYPWNALLRIQIAPTLFGPLLDGCSYLFAQYESMLWMRLQQRFSASRKVCMGTAYPFQMLSTQRTHTHTNGHCQYRM